MSRSRARKTLDPPTIEERLERVSSGASADERRALEAHVKHQLDSTTDPPRTFTAVVRRWVLQDVPMSIEALSFAEAEQTITLMKGVKLISLTVHDDEKEAERGSSSQPAGD